MKPKLILVVVFALMLALVTGVAMAGRGPGNGSGQCPYGGPGNGGPGYGGGGPGYGGNGGQCPFDGVKVDGVITSIDAANMVLAVDTGDGKIVNVIASDETVIKMGRDKLDFSDLKVDQTIRACGELDGSTLDAWVITVRYRGR